MTSDHVATKPIRGSTLLLAGRISSMGANLLIQILIVRHLSRGDYGAWAYALSIIAFLQSVAAMGLDKAITRFLSIYHERKEYDKLFGTALLMLGAILCLSALIIAGFLLWPSAIGGLVKDGSQTIPLLLVAVFLIPLEAVDTLLHGMFACFGRAGFIFVRRYVLAPFLKLAAVLIMTWLDAGLISLAYGYLAASAVGLSIHGMLAVRLFRSEGLFEHFHITRVQTPVKEILSFTLPLLSTDLVRAFLATFGVILLGYFHNLEEVGLYRVAVPLAAVNVAVMRSFALLYTPAAARLFAKQDYEGINDLYWRTAVWLAVLTFPLFAFTFSAAPSLVGFLYGPEYAQSGMYLALLSLGQYCNAASGFNGLTLKIVNRIRYVVTINIVAAVLDAAVSLILIPLFGALGAAVAAAGTMLLHSALNQAGLRHIPGMSTFDWRYLPTYSCIAAGAAGLLAMQLLLPGQTRLMLIMALLSSVAVFLMCRRTLNVAETFPEVLRFRWARAILT
jgi:O-antigen/teichoic acid export membrane protein